jgi:hypothetical protein
MCFVLDQRNELDFYSASSLEQHSPVRHADTLKENSLSRDRHFI